MDTSEILDVPIECLTTYEIVGLLDALETELEKREEEENAPIRPVLDEYIGI